MASEAQASAVALRATPASASSHARQKVVAPTLAS
jgi:hypothetical protein